MSKVVRIQDNAYNKLCEFAHGFETPSQVLDRVLDTVTLFSVYKAQTYGTKAYENAFNALCKLAEDKDWHSELAEYALKATDDEIANFIEKKLLGWK